MSGTCMDRDTERAIAQWATALKFRVAWGELVISKADICGIFSLSCGNVHIARPLMSIFVHSMTSRRVWRNNDLFDLLAVRVLVDHSSDLLCACWVAEHFRRKHSREFATCAWHNIHGAIFSSPTTPTTLCRPLNFGGVSLFRRVGGANHFNHTELSQGVDNVKRWFSLTDVCRISPLLHGCILSHAKSSTETPAGSFMMRKFCTQSTTGRCMTLGVRMVDNY